MTEVLEEFSHRGARARARGEQEAHALGEREHPLAHRGFGQNTVNEVGRRVGHPSSPARRTETAPLAGEGLEIVAQAARAVHASEAAEESAALEEAPQLAFDEARPSVAGALIPRTVEEDLEVRHEDLVQHAALGLTPTR